MTFELAMLIIVAVLSIFNLGLTAFIARFVIIQAEGYQELLREISKGVY